MILNILDCKSHNDRFNITSFEQNGLKKLSFNIEGIYLKLHHINLNLAWKISISPNF
jgi:hypothetical protein